VRVLEADRTSDTLNYSAGVTLTQPAFLSPRHAASVGLFAERRSEFQAYTRVAIGANVALTLNARRNVPVTLAYGSRRAAPRLILRCSAAYSGFAPIATRLSSRPGDASRGDGDGRARSRELDPRSDGREPGDPERHHTSRVVGSDPFYEFNRGELEVSKYYRWAARRVRLAGARRTILPQNITLSGQSVRLVPRPALLRGGPNSVRGTSVTDWAAGLCDDGYFGAPHDAVRDTLYDSLTTTAPTAATRCLFSTPSSGSPRRCSAAHAGRSIRGRRTSVERGRRS